MRNLRAGYGATQVLHGLDFSIEEGTITTLLGANGAGKTTTLRALCNMIRDQRRGAVRRRAHRRQAPPRTSCGSAIAHVPDGRGTFTSLTTEENLRLGAFARRDKAAAAQDYERVYRLFPAPGGAPRPAGRHAFGRRSSRCWRSSRALMLRPRLLLLDEPSFGLAPLIVKEIFGDHARRSTASRRSPSCWSSRTPRWRWTWPTTPTCWRPAASCCRAPAEEIQRNDAVRRSYLGY